MVSRVCCNLVKLLFEKLCEFCQSPDVSIGVVSFTVSGDSNHDCPADGEILIFLFLSPPPPGRLKMVLFHALSFSLWFKMIDPGFICSNNPGWDAISLTFKTCPQLEKMAFLSVLCSIVRLPGIHPVHTFKYPRSRMMRLKRPLLIKRLSACCWVVMHQSLQIMASTH